MNVNHLTFFENLVKAYPNLTPNERRLCTLMHLNMSTKEISNITHQSINSINTARTRLRKKFNLSGDDTSLVAFLDQFDTKKETNF
jgi:DNA-binding CsgD family transcriptional regulator